VATLSVNSDAPFAIIGRAAWLTARAADSHGVALHSNDVRWTTSDPGIVSLAPACTHPCEETLVIPQRDGVVTVTAEWGGRTASMTITSIVTPPTTSIVAIDSFTVEEITGRDLHSWWYLPSLRLTELSGTRSIDVIGMALTFPSRDELYELSPVILLCGSGTPIGAGASINVFDTTETGRLDWYTAWGDGDEGMLRAGPGDVLATVYVRDANGAIGAVTASGPIKPASATTVASYEIYSQQLLHVGASPVGGCR
jgi:hypothetical protein